MIKIFLRIFNRKFIAPIVGLTLYLHCFSAYAQKDDNHTQILFDNNMLMALEAEYLWYHSDMRSYIDFLWTQPSQLSIEDQKKITYYRIAELNNNKSSAIFDLTKIANSQSEFYFSEVSSLHLANYYFNQGRYAEALNFIRMTTPFAAPSNKQWNELMLKKAYCLYKEGQYLSSYDLFSHLSKLYSGKGKAYALFYKGFLEYLLGNYASSITTLKTVDREEPFSTIAPLLVEQSWFKQAKFDSALEYAQSHPFVPKKEDSLSPVLWKKIVGYAAFQQKRYPIVIENYKTLPIFNSKKENDLRLTYQYAYALYKEAALDEAQILLEYIFSAISSKDSLSNETAFLLAAIYLKTDQKEKARTFYGNVRNSLSKKEESDLAKFSYAKLSLELGYVNDAIEELRKLYVDTAQPYREEVTDHLAQALAVARDYEASYDLVKEIKNPSENLQKLVPDIYYAYALLLIKKSDYTTSDSLLSYVESHPFTSKNLLADVYFWKIEIYAALQNFSNAAKYTQAYEDMITEKFPLDKVRKFSYNYGYLLLANGNYKEAVSFFNHAAKETEDFSSLTDWEIDALVYQADCYLMLKRYSKAYRDYERLIAHPNKYSDYAYYQNCQIIGYQHPKEKEKMIDRFENLFPNSSYLYKILMEKVDILMNDNRYADAISILNKIQSKAKEDPAGEQSVVPQTDILLRLALANYNIKNYDEADSLYRFIIAHYPQTEANKEAIRILKTISVERNETGKFYDFLDSQEMGLEEQEKDSLDFSVIKNLIADESEDKAVKAATEQYLQKHPQGIHAAQANFILAQKAQEQGKLDVATSYYKAVALLPQNEWTESSILALAKISYFDLKDYSLAKGYFEDIKKNSENPTYKKEALRGLLRIYYTEKNWGLGFRIAEELAYYPIQTSDDNDLIHITYGKSYQLDKKHEVAIDQFKKISEKSYYYPEATYEVARSYLAMDSVEKAKRTALDITKLNTPNRFFYNRTYLLLGDIFIKEKDYFNAKATLGSLIQHTRDSALREEAQTRLDEIGVVEDTQQ